MSAITSIKSFFTSYELLELSVQKPVSDVIFGSIQPLNVTEIILSEYESEVDYASPILILLDIFNDLFNLAKALLTLALI